MRLIGISGYKTAGKDSTFLAIKAARPELNVQRVGFADKLKIIAAQALGFDMTDEQLIAEMDDCKQSWEIEITRPSVPDHIRFSGRKYLQWFGNHAREVFGTNFWIDQVLPVPSTNYELDLAVQDDLCELHERYPGVDILCITDVRYPNEAERILALGGEIWNVERQGTSSDGHVSEIPLDSAYVDINIHNNETLSQLTETAGALL